MHLRLNRESFLAILNQVVGVVERRQTLPILGNLLLRADSIGLTIIGTDMEIEVKSHCEAEVLEGGEITVPARKLSDICRSLVEGTEFSLKVAGERCVLTAGRGRFVLGTLPAQDFPVGDFDVAEKEFSLEEGALRRILDKTSFAMAQQDVRYYLNGLLLQVDGKVIKAVATDGHRLAAYEHVCNDDMGEACSVIVPCKAVTELRRVLGQDGRVVKVEIGPRTIRFSYGNSIMTTKLVDGRYPDYERVIPAMLSKRASTERDGLRRALARTSILSNEKFRGVRVSFEPGVLRLVAHNPEQEEAVEELELDYDGEPMMIGFNVGYLSELLGAVDTDSVEVAFEDGNNSSLWRGSGALRETYVVMPMRL